MQEKPREVISIDSVLDGTLEAWLDPLVKFIIDYDNAHGHETARQFLLSREDFKPHSYDSLLGLTKDPRYQAKNFAREYLFSGRTPYHTSPGHMPGLHPEGLASTVYEIINKFPDVW